MRKFNWTPAKENDRKISEAAPEMYEALKKAEALYTSYGLLAQSPECGPWINAVRDALAKADGKPTRSPAPDQPASRREP